MLSFLNCSKTLLARGPTCFPRSPASFSPDVTYRGTHNKNWRNAQDNEDIPKNVLEPWITAHTQSDFGAVYDCKPFKMILEKDKVYRWCACGWGYTQPMCDNTHRFHRFPITMKPVLVKVKETKEYWLCNCKQTKNRPFCDGSHRDPKIQEQCQNKVVATG